MGTINCTVNADTTLTINSISGMNASNTWARLHNIVFEISGGGTFELAFSVVEQFSTFQFDPSDPIDWITSQPSWIQISSTATPTELRLQAESSQANASSSFRIRNAATGGQQIEITVKSMGGSGGTGGTLSAYVESDQSMLIGQLPPGAVVTGMNVFFGIKDEGVNNIFLLSGETGFIQGIDWPNSQPGFVSVTETSSQLNLAIDNAGTSPSSSEFLIETPVGEIDPTIVTNPDENAP